MATIIDLKIRLERAIETGLCIPSADAHQLVAGVIGDLVREFGGSPIYIGKRPTTDADVLADFDGSNHAEVCRIHKISRSTLQKKVRAANIAHRE